MRRNITSDTVAVDINFLLDGITTPCLLFKLDYILPKLTAYVNELKSDKTEINDRDEHYPYLGNIIKNFYPLVNCEFTIKGMVEDCFKLCEIIYQLDSLTGRNVNSIRICERYALCHFE